MTEIGDDCLIMTQAHVAHDYRIGNHVILGNSVGLAGLCARAGWNSWSDRAVRRRLDEVKTRSSSRTGRT